MSSRRKKSAVIRRNLSVMSSAVAAIASGKNTGGCPSSTRCPTQRKPARKKRPAAYVNVNSHTIKKNAARLEQGEPLQPPLALRRGKSQTPEYGHRILIHDKNGEVVGSFEYEPRGGLKCGARVFAVLKYPPTLVSDTD